VVIDGGIAGAVWAAAKRGSTSVALTPTAARSPICFIVSSPVLVAPPKGHNASHGAK